MQKQDEENEKSAIKQTKITCVPEFYNKSPCQSLPKCQSIFQTWRKYNKITRKHGNLIAIMKHNILFSLPAKTNHCISVIEYKTKLNLLFIGLAGT